MLYKHTKFLLLLFVFSCVVRILFFEAFFHRNKQYWRGDSQQYHDPAVQLVKGNGLVDKNGAHWFYRVPGYSFFLAACYKLFGINVLYAVWIQMILSAFIPLLIFLLSLVFFPLSIFGAKIASSIAAVHLGYVMHAGMVMSDSLFVIFFINNIPE